MEKLLQVDQIDHIYNAGANEEVTALSNINLEINQGEFVAIIGRNGSGKSTLAKHF